MTPHREAKRLALEDFERRYIETVMASAKGNVTRAAQLAGMDRSNFRRLLATYRDKE